MIAPGDTLRVRRTAIHAQDFGADRVVLEFQGWDGAYYLIDVSLSDLVYNTRAAFLNVKTDRERRAYDAADAIQRQHDAAYTAQAEAAFAKMEKAAEDAASAEGPI
jgi:hypothetical protein